MPTNNPSDMSPRKMIEALVCAAEQVTHGNPDAVFEYERLEAALIGRLNRVEGLEARIVEAIDRSYREWWKMVADGSGMSATTYIKNEIRATFAAVREEGVRQ